MFFLKKQVQKLCIIHDTTNRKHQAYIDIDVRLWIGIAVKRD